MEVEVDVRGYVLTSVTGNRWRAGGKSLRPDGSDGEVGLIRVGAAGGAEPVDYKGAWTLVRAWLAL